MSTIRLETVKHPGAEIDFIAAAFPLPPGTPVYYWDHKIEQMAECEVLSASSFKPKLPSSEARQELIDLGELPENMTDDALNRFYRREWTVRVRVLDGTRTGELATMTDDELFVIVGGG